VKSTANVLAIDVGTTSTRAALVDGRGRVLGRAAARSTLTCPGPGRVEQDAEVLWRAVLGTLHGAFADAGVAATDVAAVGITGQRASTIVWDRSTGTPLAPLMSWQDLSCVDRATELTHAGYVVFPQTSAAKLEALLDRIPQGRQRAHAGEIVWGNVDAYVAFRLSGGTVFATDTSQASATGYYDPFADTWNAALLALQGLPAAMFPRLCGTEEVVGYTASSLLGERIPIAAIVADQQSALIARDSPVVGTTKITFGTSATCDVDTGPEIRLAAGTYPMVLNGRGEGRRFCLEGMVITAGATLDWLVTLGLAPSVQALDREAAQVPDSGGVSMLPALQGLGTPHMSPERRGVFAGLTRSSTRGHLARAALESVAFRCREILGAMRTATGVAPDAVHVDGGGAVSDLWMQIHADVLGVPVVRPVEREATLLGAALCAGRAAGLRWPSGDAAFCATERVFEPRGSDAGRESRFDAWRTACALTEAG